MADLDTTTVSSSELPAHELDAALAALKSAVTTALHEEGFVGNVHVEQVRLDKESVAVTADTIFPGEDKENQQRFGTITKFSSKYAHPNEMASFMVKAYLRRKSLYLQRAAHG